MFLIGRGNMGDAPMEAMLQRTKMLYNQVKGSSASIVEMLDALKGR
jgi:hypothetical protein